MKPRTILQREVVELSSRLLPISQKEKEWAFKECLEHRGYANKSSVFCLDCGETFSLELIKRKSAVCPHCKTKLSIQETRKTTDTQTVYFAIAEVMGEFQVIRNFELIAHYKKGLEKNIYQSEILQYWIHPKGKVTMYGLQHSLNYHCDYWGGKHEIRDKGHRWYNQNKYEVYPYKYHPNSVFKREYEKYGINYNLQGVNAVQAIKHVPQNPKLETLLKAKQFSLLSQLESYRINGYWASIKICIRNKYTVKDATIWFDYLELLRYFKKDIRNAKYVCPKNLKREHNKLVQKKRKIQELQEREREKQKAIERQQNLEIAIKEYSDRIQKFLELEFSKGNISISVLKSVDEFKQEGDELKHCVYANEYYSKKDSLVLSAKVDGKRAETIELKLPEVKIEQARGLNNNTTEHHSKIIALVKQNIPKIRKIVINTKQRSKSKAVA